MILGLEKQKDGKEPKSAFTGPPKSGTFAQKHKIWKYLLPISFSKYAMRHKCG